MLIKLNLYVIAVFYLVVYGYAFLCINLLSIICMWQSEAKLESKEESQLEGEGRPSMTPEQKLAMQ